MKKIISLVSVSILAVSLFAFTSSVNAAPLADGLVAYWNLDDGAGTNADELVDNYDGTLNGDATWGGSAPVIGSTGSASFDGDGDYVEVADTTDLDLTGSISVSGWIYLNSYSQPSTVAAKWRDIGGANERGYLLTVATNGTPRFYISTTGANYPSAVGSAVGLYGWHYLVGTYDGTDIKLYVDGALVTTTNYPGSVYANNEPLLMGANDGYGGSVRKYTDGLVDEVRIYNKALSATEVSRLYNYGTFTLDVTPETDTNPVGTNHEVTITLDTPLSFIPVLYSVSGNTAPGADTQYIYTDENGQIVFTYTGVNPGVDTIIACMDVSWFFTSGGICNAPFPEPSDTAEKTWLDIFTVSGTKYYDANTNGTNDAEAGLENWLIFVDEGNGIYDSSEPFVLTDVDGYYEFDLVDQATYSICEVVQADWLQTQPGTPEAPACYEVVVNGSDVPNNDFGNVHLVPTTGKTKGFWTNKNGFAQLNDGGTVDPELALLSVLNLVDEAGNQFDPVSYVGPNGLKMWLNKARAVNMAYMLSAQLAATELDVEAEYLTGGTLIYAPSLLPFAPITGLSATGFISITDLMDAANTELLAHPNAPETDSWWAYQNALREVLDAVNSQAVIQVE